MVLALAGPGSLAAADPIRVLPPSAAPALERAFERSEPRLVIEHATIGVDRVDARICPQGDGERGACFSIHLGDPLSGCDRRRVGPWCLSYPEGLPDDPKLVEALESALARDEQADFWKVVSARSAPHAGASAGSETPVAVSWPSGWLGSPGGLATLGWQLGLMALVGLLLATGLRRRIWRHPEALRILAELAGLVAVAFMVRWLLLPVGPGNLYSQLPDSTHPPAHFERFGPGLGAWALGWFWLLGVGDRVIFFAGAVAGSLTVIPVYCLARLSSPQRLAGLLAGALLALWPIHARLSATDDQSVLIALLLAGAMALVVAADRAAAGSLLLAAWLAAGLAASTRPEPALALAPLGLLVLLQPTSRRLQLKPLLLAGSVLVLTLTGLVLYYTISTALRGGFDPSGVLRAEHLFRLLGVDGGSVLAPPRSSWLLTICFAIGAAAALVAGRGRPALWLAAGWLPALPTASLANDGLITARYQLALVPMAAAATAVGLVWLGGRLSRRWPRLSRPAVPVLVAVPLLAAAWGCLQPPPEPTFRREYRFFRNNIKQIPENCRLLEVRWDVDLGLGPPTHLTRLLATGHSWLAVSDALDPDTACLVYWQPASCRASATDPISTADGLLPDCQLVESRYRLEPLATTYLPAITGFCETYRVEPVPIGFYRLRSRGPAEPSAEPRPAEVGAATGE